MFPFPISGVKNKSTRQKLVWGYPTVVGGGGGAPWHILLPSMVCSPSAFLGPSGLFIFSQEVPTAGLRLIVQGGNVPDLQLSFN